MDKRHKLNFSWVGKILESYLLCDWLWQGLFAAAEAFCPFILPIIVIIEINKQMNWQVVFSIGFFYYRKVWHWDNSKHFTPT